MAIPRTKGQLVSEFYYGKSLTEEKYSITTFSTTRGIETSNGETIELYVASDGDDTYDGSYDSPVATVQKALSLLPTVINCNVIIYIGEGTFDPFVLSNISISEYGSLTIQGTLVEATLATGTNTGTSTGDAYSVVDAGQNWTPGDLVGRLCKVRIGFSDIYRVIRDNDATSISFSGYYPGTTSGKTYTIYDHGSKIYDSSVAITITSLGFNQNVDALIISDVQVDVDGSAYGVLCQACAPPVFYRLKHTGTSGTIGICFKSTFGDITMEDCYSTGGDQGLQFLGALCTDVLNQKINRLLVTSSSTGIYIVGSNNVNMSTVCVDDCDNGIRLDKSINCRISSADIYNAVNYGVFCDTSTGIALAGLSIDGNSATTLGLKMVHSSVRLDYGSTIENCTSHGIQGSTATVDSYDCRSGGNLTAGFQGAVTVQNNGGSALYCGGAMTIDLDNFIGTGNTRFGVELVDGSRCLVTSTTAATGVLGDATLDDAKTALTWAGNFASNLDTEVDASGIGTAIKRRD
jgi:hypothetical protein